MNVIYLFRQDFQDFRGGKAQLQMTDRGSLGGMQRAGRRKVTVETLLRAQASTFSCWAGDEGSKRSL